MTQIDLTPVPAGTHSVDRETAPQAADDEQVVRTDPGPAESCPTGRPLLRDRVRLEHCRLHHPGHRRSSTGPRWRWRYQVDGDADVLDMPEAADGLVYYFRCISGEHPDSGVPAGDSHPGRVADPNHPEPPGSDRDRRHPRRHGRPTRPLIGPVGSVIKLRPSEP
jgi:hypothetical protein